MMKPCTAGRSKSAGRVHRDDARHRLRVARVDRRRCSRARPSSGRTRCAAGRRPRGRRSTASTPRGSPGPPCEERGYPESSPTSALHSSCAARTGRRLAVQRMRPCEPCATPKPGISVVDVPVPDRPGVRVRVRSAGICGSDLEMVRTGLAAGTLGHEIAGVLDDGTEVAVHPFVPCGELRAVPRRAPEPVAGKRRRRCSACSPTAAWPTRSSSRVVHRRAAGGDRRRRRVARRAARGLAARVQPGRDRAGDAGRRRRRRDDRVAERRGRAPSRRRRRDRRPPRRAAPGRGGARASRSTRRATATSCSRRPARRRDSTTRCAACRRAGTIGLVSTHVGTDPDLVPERADARGHASCRRSSTARRTDSASSTPRRRSRPPIPRSRPPLDHAPLRPRRGAPGVRGRGRPGPRRDQSRPASLTRWPPAGPDPLG